MGEYRKGSSGVPAWVDIFYLKVCLLLLICHVARTVDAFPTLPNNPVTSLCSASGNVNFKSAKTSLFVASTLIDDEDSISSNSAAPSPSFSTAAEWHRKRRKAMVDKYGDQIIPLERNSSSQFVGVPLLIITNLSLLTLSLISGVNDLEVYQIFGLALFPGSMFSLWQLQILHDCLHGTLFEKQSQQQQQSTSTLPQSSSRSKNGRRRKQLQNDVLFWGSMPSIFGYFLYLKYGHLTHHSNVGDPDRASLEKLFNSDQSNFEDGDVLFVAHRMKLKGEIGPTFELPFFRDIPLLPESITMSISKGGFDQWKTTSQKPGNLSWNVAVFAASFLFERFMLLINDFVVAIAGRNFFFPNKPDYFHEECTEYARAASFLRATLLLIGGWKTLLFLFLSETLWSIPPHPASAMFVSNHPSAIDETTGDCVPSMSTYAGAWYSLFTLGTNYHCEHHDFPMIPFNKLHELRQIAPEFYRSGSEDDILEVMKKSFTDPDFYACMDVHNLDSELN
jgi:fatty acid desaturase